MGNYIGKIDFFTFHDDGGELLVVSNKEDFSKTYEMPDKLSDRRNMLNSQITKALYTEIYSDVREDYRNRRV